MDNTKIQNALRAASDTEALILGEGTRDQTHEIFQLYFPGTSALVIADDITFEAAGKFLHEQLQAANVHTLEPFVFPGKPILHTDYEHVEHLRNFLQKQPNTIPIAVGAGTINDIVKRAAYESDRKYMLLATAASVDGYSAFGAALVRNGFKKNLECPAPWVIMADIEILRDAPAEMTAAGYGDLLSKITAGADWIIADTIGVNPIIPSIWDMVQTDLRKWVRAPEKLREGDPQTFEFLFEGLTMTGFAMQAMQVSRPASGSEHLFNHIWEMQHHRDATGQPLLHGFKVSIGILTSTAFMETLFTKDIKQLNIRNVCEQWKSWEERAADIQQAFRGTPIIDRVLDESHGKYLTREQLRDRLELLVAHWDELREKVKKQIIPYQEVKRMLTAAACPVKPEDIQLDREHVLRSIPLAQMIRNRYMVFDLAYELGWLEECIHDIRQCKDYL